MSRFLLTAFIATCALASTAWAADGADNPNPSTERSGANLAIGMAVDARKAGQFEQAHEILSQILKTQPDNARAHHELGVLYALHGQLKKAASHLEKALLGNSAAVVSERNLAEVLRADGQHAKALTHYKTFEHDIDARPIALRGLALCHEALGKLAEATKALQTLARDYGETEPGKWAVSHLDELSHSTEQAPISVEQAEREGSRLFEEGRYDGAGYWLGHALKLAPTADRAFRKAVCLLAIRDYLGAVAALKHALRLDGGHRPSLSAYPTALRKLRTEGKGGIQVSIRQSDNSPPTVRAARALLEDDLLLAERIATVAAKRPGGGLVLKLLGAEALLRAGHPRRAEKVLRSTLKARPKHPAATRALAEALYRTGRIVQARRLVGLAPPDATGSEKSAEDLAHFSRWRRSSFDHQLRMMLDPGIKPQAAYQPAEVFNPESIRPAAPVVQPAPERRKTRRRRRRR